MISAVIRHDSGENVSIQKMNLYNDSKQFPKNESLRFVNETWFKENINESKFHYIIYKLNNGQYHDI